MHTVGVTGGIGSGKSTICKVFHQLGVAIYDADGRGKALLKEDVLVKEQVVSAFGTEAYHSDGSVNKVYLADKVFSDSEALATLNGIVHPSVRIDFERWVCEQKGPYVLKEAAILIESGAYQDCDEVIVVEANIESRLKRVIDRDQADESQVRERMNAQMSDEERNKYAHHTIDNNEDQLIIPQILRIHEDIIRRTSS